MVKNLYLLRHADAESAADTGRDIDRNLSPEGLREAGSLAELLLEKHISLDTIFCSTAVRVHQTYEQIASSLFGDSVPQYLDKLYNPDLTTVLELLKHLDDSSNAVLIISHNPTIGDLATYLTGEQIHFSPGVLKYLQLEVKSWDETSGSCSKLVWSIPNKF